MPPSIALAALADPSSWPMLTLLIYKDVCVHFFLPALQYISDATKDYGDWSFPLRVVPNVGDELRRLAELPSNLHFLTLLHVHADVPNIRLANIDRASFKP
ncbi:MAG: hypothetical protein Tsb0027_16120 [Wenzhouxiangellaceae bacterium]